MTTNHGDTWSRSVYLSFLLSFLKDDDDPQLCQDFKIKLYVKKQNRGKVIVFSVSYKCFINSSVFISPLESNPFASNFLKYFLTWFDWGFTNLFFTIKSLLWAINKLFYYTLKTYITYDDPSVFEKFWHLFWVQAVHLWKIACSSVSLWNYEQR